MHLNKRTIPISFEKKQCLHIHYEKKDWLLMYDHVYIKECEHLITWVHHMPNRINRINVLTHRYEHRYRHIKSQNNNLPPKKDTNAILISTSIRSFAPWAIAIRTIDPRPISPLENSPFGMFRT